MGTTTGARRLQARMFYVITAVVVVMALGSWAVGVTRDGGGNATITAKDEASPSETTPFDLPPMPPDTSGDDIFDALDDVPTDGPTVDLDDLDSLTPGDPTTDDFTDPFADPTFVDPSFPDDPVPAGGNGGNGGGGSSDDDPKPKPKPKPKPQPTPTPTPSDSPSDEPSNDPNPECKDDLINNLLCNITKGP